MDTAPLNVEIYQTSAGKQPLMVWIRSLKNKQAQALILSRINRLRQGHWGDFKALSEGLYELRVHHGPGYRIYFAQEGNRLILLMSGGDKSTQARDIQKALTYLRDYRSMNNG